MIKDKNRAAGGQAQKSSGSAKIPEKVRHFIETIARHVPLSRSWMISYLVVLILPLIVSQLFYRQSARLADQNAAEVCDIALEQTILTLDRSMEDVRAVGRELLTRDEVQSLQYAGSLNAVKRFKISQLNKALSRQVNYHASIDKIALVFTESGVATSTEGFYDSEAVIRQQFSQAWGIDYDEILHSSGRKKDLRFILNDGKLFAVLDMESDGDVPRVILVFNLNMNYVRQLLVSENSATSPVVWMVTENGCIITPYGVNSEQMDTMLEQTAPYLSSGRERDAIHAENLVLSTATSEMTGWQLVSATSTSFYSEKLGAIRRWYLVYLMICLAVGVLVSLYFSQRNYSPVKRLSDLLQENNQTESPDGGVFERLEENLSRLIQKEQDYEREIDRQKKSLRASSLVRVMKGTLYSEDAFKAACKEYGMEFNGRRFGMVGIMIRDYKNLFFDGQATEDEKTQELAQYVTISVTEELIREVFTGYMCVSENRLYAVLSAPDGMDEKEYKEKIWDICQQAEVFIRERLGIELCYYLTGLYDCGEGKTPESIRNSYEEAQWGMEQIIGFERTDAIVQRDMLVSEPQNTGFDPDFSARGVRRRQYIAAVCSGDFEESGRLYRELRQEGIYHLDQSFSSLRAQTVMLYDLLVSSLLTSRQMTEESVKLGEFAVQFEKARGIHELEKIIRSAEEMIYQLRRPSESKEEPYSVRVARYVGEHYMDPELSVASVAEYLGVSQSYLLRVFKKEGSGCSVSDYIHRRRVDEAKILLKTTDDTVGDIALKVGYANSLALIRAFKRLENGKTPTEYRSEKQ